MIFPVLQRNANSGNLAVQSPRRCNEAPAGHFRGSDVCRELGVLECDVKLHCAKLRCLPMLENWKLRQFRALVHPHTAGVQCQNVRMMKLFRLLPGRGNHFINDQYIIHIQPYLYIYIYIYHMYQLYAFSGFWNPRHFQAAFWSVQPRCSRP